MEIYLVIFLVILLYFLTSKNKKENFESRIKINDAVDCVYVLNLDKDIERMNKLKMKLKKLNIKFKRVSGVMGKNVYHKYNTNLRPGQLGCLLSHLKIIKDAKERNFKKILVLEDDIVFDKKFEDKFNHKYKNINKKEDYYDILYLGCSQAAWKSNLWKFTENYGEYYSVSKTDGTFAMILSSTIFDEILSYPRFDKPIDVLLSDLILSKKKYKSFSLFPHVISSNVADLSNTDNKRRDLDLYFKKNKLKILDFEF